MPKVAQLGVRDGNPPCIQRAASQRGSLHLTIGATGRHPFFFSTLPMHLIFLTPQVHGCHVGGYVNVLFTFAYQQMYKAP